MFRFLISSDILQPGQIQKYINNAKPDFSENGQFRNLVNTPDPEFSECSQSGKLYISAQPV